MPLTEFQRTICRLIARQRLESGESYVAGAAALNALTGAERISRDIDLFHDTSGAVALSGKDPGFSPAMILDQAGRSAHYSRAEISALSFAGAQPDVGELSRRWQAVLKEAHELVATLPPTAVGKCVLKMDGTLFMGDVEELRVSLSAGKLQF